MKANHKFSSKYGGFTLLELMTTILIATILTSLAVASYKKQQERAAYSAAMAEMSKLAEQLGRYKARNFNFRGFNPSYLYGSTGVVTSVTLPVGATGNSIAYTLTLVDISTTTPTPLAEAALASGATSTLGLGQQWAILASRNESNTLQKTNYNLLLTSTGVRCKTKIAVANVTTLSSYQGCGNASEAW